MMILLMIQKSVLLLPIKEKKDQRAGRTQKCKRVLERRKIPSVPEYDAPRQRALLGRGRKNTFRGGHQIQVPM